MTPRLHLSHRIARGLWISASIPLTTRRSASTTPARGLHVLAALLVAVLVGLAIGTLLGAAA